MKRDKMHVVPLSAEALELLRSLPRGKGAAQDKLLFEQAWSSDYLKVLREAAGFADVTLHGTARSGFADWATTEGYTDRLIDYSLSHYPADLTAAAYKREGLVEQRREPMARWARFLTAPKAKPAVAPIRTMAAE
jgi:integrase